MMDIYKLIERADKKGLLQSAGWKREFLDAYISDYEWSREFNKEEITELKSFQKDLRYAFDTIEKERQKRYNTGAVTREDIVRLLDRNIYDNAKQWGENYLYTELAREHKNKVLNAYDNNLGPVSVAKIDWHYKDGFDYEYHLYTDGTVKCSIYGAY